MEHTCCFIGHRTINETERLKLRLYEVIETLISEKGVDTFLFGSGSRFNDLCLEIVTDLKRKYPHIKRIYVRAEYPYISDDYEKYLLKTYESTYYPQKIIGAGKAVYIERNFEMIDKSAFCIFYYDEQSDCKEYKSGTKIALDYAFKMKKTVFSLNSD